MFLKCLHMECAIDVGSICYPVRTLTLERSSSGSLGFSIVGGYSWHDSAPDGSSITVPVFVKSVLPSGPASKDGRLR